MSDFDPGRLVVTPPEGDGDRILAMVAALAKLREPFGPEHVGKLPKAFKKDSAKGKCAPKSEGGAAPDWQDFYCGGFHGLPAVHLDYVGHGAITARLLDVDPLWNWEPAGLTADGRPAFELDRNSNPVGLWIKLTVCGVTRPASGVALDPVGLRRPRVAGPSEPHPPSVWDGNNAPTSANPGGGPIGATRDAEPLVLACLPPGRPAVSSAPPVLDGLLEVPERLLLHLSTASGEPRCSRAGFSELLRPLSETRRRPQRRPVAVHLLEGEVPHVPSVGAVVDENQLLLRGRVEPEPHAHIVRTPSDGVSR